MSQEYLRRMYDLGYNDAMDGRWARRVAPGGSAMYSNGYQDALMSIQDED